jgi:protein-tyrosine phosphatase
MRPALHVIAWPGPGRLATMAHPRGGAWLADEMAGLAWSGVDVLVSALTSDEERRLNLHGVAQAAAHAGIEYVPFPIADRGVPRDSYPVAGAMPRDLHRADRRTAGSPLAARNQDVVALGVRLAAHVRAGRFVVTQCFAGIGRSTLLAGTTLIMLGVGPETALRMVGEARGLPVPDTEAQRRWLYDFAATHGGVPVAP